jgi:hypothetical protein
MTDISGQRPEEIMILKKAVCNSVSLLDFSTRLPLPESAYLSEIVIRVPVAPSFNFPFRYKDDIFLSLVILLIASIPLSLK